MWIHCLSSAHAFAIACGFVWSCCVFCCFFNFLWRGWVIGSSFLASRFFFGLDIAWMWVDWYSYYTTALFLPWYRLTFHLLGFLWACHISSYIIRSLSFRCPVFLLGQFLYHLRLPRPILFLWASLAHLILSCSLHSCGLLLNILGFLDPITISFTFGFIGLRTNPLY